MHGLLDKPKRCMVLYAILQRGPGARLRFRLAWRVLCAVPSREAASMPAASSMQPAALSAALCQCPRCFAALSTVRSLALGCRKP